MLLGHVLERLGDEAFKAVVDRALRRLLTGGEALKIYNRWFLRPIPPRGLNLNFPMSDSLKEAVKNPNDTGVGACGKMKC